ncbi:YadA C-terminal domain-containing protein [Enterobacter mori]|uniref:YadA C-terminal domain-containing protein n=1 Tax=Enterobacter mori TaxID=539813 RepID=UPI001C6646F3|nr:YadA C-terminal domain-containing protein [Enterobacter mori]MBW8246604.1 YadA C-terminal domain-containing protein [Enterobacter mori]MBW8250919.1 YadA C-terminal domain-containing protein [Enterobacter mori]
MKPLNKSVIAVAVFGALFAGSMNIANAVDFATDANGSTQWAENIQGKVDGLSNDDYLNGEAIKAAQTTATNAEGKADSAISEASSALSLAGSAKTDAKTAIDAADTVGQKLTTVGNALQGEINQEKIDRDNADHLIMNTVDNHDVLLSEHETRIAALENQPTPKDGKDGIDGKNGIDGKDGATGAQGVQGVAGKDGADGKNGIDGKAGKDGVDGKNGFNGKDGKNGLNGKDGVNGKNGVTTTITKKEVDTKTINLVKSLNTQTTAQAKDLKAAQQVFAQAQSSSNAQFKNLKDEVDDNKKEARGGVASAVAIASMPQVEKDQAMMFSAGVGSFKNEQAISVGASFHAGEHTVIKAGISDSTNNDLAMGAGIGIGF